MTCRDSIARERKFSDGEERKKGKGGERQRRKEMRREGL